ncbi:hypothetical protein KSP40_PGU000025 [Platanthera guangdongensis]|uniref:FAD-dependent oxidoreductase 2 FAD-binding domain-containing protein n=1 Tax=Platanthera guangdongensis TaxID=2320717 RepID=A0ABR2M733_9ASPA
MSSFLKSSPSRTFRLCCKGCNSFLAPSNYNNTTRRTEVFCCLQENVTQYFDFIVVCSGVTGLSYAIEVSKHGSVAIITKAEPRECNTNYAQGGYLSVAIITKAEPRECNTNYAQGGYLCDEETVRDTSGKKRPPSLVHLEEATRAPHEEGYYYQDAQ